MSVHETDRHKLWLSLCDTIGESRANTLMSMLPMQSDLQVEVQTDLLALRSNMGGMRVELKEEMAEMRREMSQMQRKLGTQIARLAIVLGLSVGALVIAMVGTLLTLVFSGAFA